MSKLALVIPTEDRFKPVEQWRAEMMARDLCETDPRYLQVLPYISLINEHNEVFVYTRGNAGQESRLHSKRSIGLGGHIDELPGKRHMVQLLIDEAARELEEEVGFKPSVWTLITALENAIFIYEPLTDVDSVHLAVAMQIPVKQSDLVKLEDGVIVSPQWYRQDELTTYLNMERFVKPQCLLWTFETWSKLFAAALTNDAVRARHVAKWQETAQRYFFYCDIVAAMKEVGIDARVNSEKGLKIEVALWKTEEDIGEGYVEWSLNLDRHWTKLYKTIEGYVISDATGEGEIMLTTNFVLWEHRDASTLHHIDTTVSKDI